MSNIKCLILDFEDLTDKEQLDLWLELFTFSDKKLPSERVLKIGIVKK